MDNVDAYSIQLFPTFEVGQEPVGYSDRRSPLVGKAFVLAAPIHHEIGGAKFDHGSGGIVPLRAA